ncbi:MAG: hypothetical protein Q9157_004044 [Trypethelium eluteriae]
MASSALPLPPIMNLQDRSRSITTVLGQIREMNGKSPRYTNIDAFIRDELSKGRYDPAIAGICFEMLLELFNRTLRSELGPRAGGDGKVEDVC